MARIDYWSIENELAEIIKANTRAAYVCVEEQIQFGADNSPWVGVYVERRDALSGMQTLSMGQRTRMKLHMVVWVWCFSLEMERAIKDRDDMVGELELVLMQNREINGLVDTLWITGGRLPSARIANRENRFEGDVFISGAEILIVADVVADSAS